jgi:serine/threonine protein kinase
MTINIRKSKSRSYKNLKKLCRIDDPWEILPENVLINYENKLGSGAFGDVYSAKLIGDTGIKRVYPNVLMLVNFHDCKVAVKTLPAYADDLCKSEFHQEINFMKSLECHPHLVCLLGYVTNAVKPLLVLEFCANGDLLHFIRERKERYIQVDFLYFVQHKFIQIANDEGNPKTKELVSFAWQISNGLEYLAHLGLIHRYMFQLIYLFIWFVGTWLQEMYSWTRTTSVK